MDKIKEESESREDNSQSTISQFEELFDRYTEAKAELFSLRHRRSHYAKINHRINLFYSGLSLFDQNLNSSYKVLVVQPRPKVKLFTPFDFSTIELPLAPTQQDKFKQIFTEQNEKMMKQLTVARQEIQSGMHIELDIRIRETWTRIEGLVNKKLTLYYAIEVLKERVKNLNTSMENARKARVRR